MKGYFSREEIQMKPSWQPKIEKETLYIPDLGISMNSEGHTNIVHGWWFNEARFFAGDRLQEVELDDNDVLKITKARASLTAKVTEFYNKATE